MVSNQKSGDVGLQISVIHNVLLALERLTLWWMWPRLLGMTSTEDPHAAKQRKIAPFTDFVNAITCLGRQLITAGRKAWKPHTDKGRSKGQGNNVL
jgi:hypothetical protein